MVPPSTVAALPSLLPATTRSSASSQGTRGRGRPSDIPIAPTLLRAQNLDLSSMYQLGGSEHANLPTYGNAPSQGRGDARTPWGRRQATAGTAQPWVGVSGISPSSCTKGFLLIPKTPKLIPTAQPLISPWEPGVINKGRSWMLSAPACCWVNNTSWAGCLYGAEHTWDKDESLFPPWGQAGVAALPEEGFPGFNLRGEGPCWLGNVLVGFPAPGISRSPAPMLHFLLGARPVSYHQQQSLCLRSFCCTKTPTAAAEDR